MSRRRLPAPPLVLRPLFLRVAEDTVGAKELVRLAEFLRAQAMLTGGGESKLQLGLAGPGNQCSLTLQDVRSWAHGLVEQLVLSISAPEQWSAHKEQYLISYDRGKPRRPTHLQRLYQRWSSDLHWTGLIMAAQRHPRIWSDIKQAIDFLEAPSQEKHILALALSLKSSRDWTAWQRLFESNSEHREAYLRMLPLMGETTLEERIAWLESYLSKKSPEEHLRIPAVFCALKRREDPLFFGSCPNLLDQNLQLVQTQFGNVNPLLLYALITTVNRPSQLPRLRVLVSPKDPVLKIGYGARPGIGWADELWGQLRAKLGLV